MRRYLGFFLATFGLSALTGWALPPQQQPEGLERGVTLPGVSWVQAAEISAGATSLTPPEDVQAYPIVLLETNYYTFEPGQRLQLRVSLYPNGWVWPVTLYLYRQDRTTGAKEYYSVRTGSFQSQPRDLFGSESEPMAVYLPALEDFVLFGSASDGSDNGFGLDGALGPSFTAPSSPGLFQFVMEVRDAEGRRVLAKSNAMYSFVTQTVEVSGAITTNTTWQASKAYRLRDFVAVRNATLTIEPGTVIYGGDPRATLFITRGARIIADGTAMRPIIFTSPNRVGRRAQRDWGSLVLLGNAPINEPGGQAYLEGLPSQPDYAFGGNNPNDSSGVLRYVRLEFGGFEIEANQEINGLTLAGVGDGTVIDYVQVLYNKDDGVEFFGGTVNAKHLLLVAAADDGVDTDLGYRGKIQWVVILDSPINDEPDSNVGFESDNHPQNFDLTPRTRYQIYNVTAVAPPVSAGGKGLYGARIRRGAAGSYHNIIITGSQFAPVTVESTQSQNLAGTELIFDHSILHGNFADAAFKSGSNPAFTRKFMFEDMKFNRNVDPQLKLGAWSAAKLFYPNLEPLANSPALDANFVQTPPDDGFFDTNVSCIGGVCPGDNWVLSGWAVFSNN